MHDLRHYLWRARFEDLQHTPYDAAAFGDNQATILIGGGERRLTPEHISLRHCIASAWLARETSCAFAACVGHNREQWQYYQYLVDPTDEDANDRGESQRGEYRNRIGRRIAGCGGDNADGPGAAPIAISDQQIISRCRAAWSDGTLDATRGGIRLPIMNDEVPYW